MEGGEGMNGSEGKEIEGKGKEVTGKGKGSQGKGS